MYKGLGRLRSHPSNRHGDPTFTDEQHTLPDVWIARGGREIDALRTCLFHARATYEFMSCSLHAWKSGQASIQVQASLLSLESLWPSASVGLRQRH